MRKTLLLNCLLFAFFATSLNAEFSVSENNIESEKKEIRSLIVQFRTGSNKEANIEILKKGKSAVPILVELLEDGSEDAAVILGMFGADALEAIPSLMVYKKNFENRNRPPFMDHSRSSWFIDVALMKIGVHTKEAVPYLTQTLDVNDYMVRLYATEALREIGPDAVYALPTLIKLTNYTNTRELAASAIEAIGPGAKDAVPALIEILCTPKASTEERAASKALITIGVPAVPVLQDALVHENAPEVIWSIAWVLGEIGPDAKGAVPELAYALENKNTRTRRGVADALRKIGPSAKQALSNLTQHFNDEDPYVRVTAAAACCAIDPNARSAAISAMIRQLESSSGASIEVARTLVTLGPEAEPAVPALTKKLTSSNANLRSACTHALGSIGIPAIEAVPALLKILDDQYVSIRVEAAESLWQIEHKVRTEVIAVLVDALKDTSITGRNAAKTLSKIGESTVPFLIEVVKKRCD